MKKLLLALALLIICHVAFSQSIKISGAVTDAETNEGIPGTAIVIKGKLTGTVTDADGKFELSTAIKPPFTIVISIVGYQSQEREIPGADAAVAISLSPTSVIMDEV